MHPFEKFYQKHKVYAAPHVYVQKALGVGKAEDVFYERQNTERYWPSLTNFTYVFQAKMQEVYRDSPQDLPDWTSALNLMWAFTAYAFDKRIYVVKKQLSDSLRYVKFPENAPTTCLSIPKTHAVILCLQGFSEFDWFTCAVEKAMDVFCVESSSKLTDHLIVRGIKVHENGEPSCINILTLEIDSSISISQALATELDRRRQSLNLRGESHLTEAFDVGEETLNALLGVLAYIKADKDTVTQVHPGRKKFKGWSQKAFKNSTLFAPAEFTVGDGFAKVIEHYELGIEQSEGVSGRAMRPHIRRPHAHLYHTKEGPIIHFLPPIPVKGADIKDYDPERPMKILVK